MNWEQQIPILDAPLKAVVLGAVLFIGIFFQMIWVMIKVSKKEGSDK